MIFLVDIDGTLADLSHRLHFIQQKPANWKAFFAACPDDSPIWDVIDTVNALSDSGANIILVTGRSEDVEEQTENWLDVYLNRWSAMYMRKSGDHREDNIVKSELLDQIIADQKPVGDENPKITGVFEDRQQVVDMYRARGLRVFQVAKGDF
jgi:phosphoglycolate phosphatase-like HAD superfamily hydrolase